MKYKIKYILLFCSFLMTIHSYAQFNIIPQPVEINYSKAHNVTIDSTFSIKYYSFDLADEAEMLSDYFLKFHQLKIPAVFMYQDEDTIENAETHWIIFDKNNYYSEKPTGYYELNVLPDNIQINGNEAGIFYGIQTFMQMTFSNLNLQSCQITDYPRFSWRGMHLDVSRHFFGVDFIKKYIDLLAMYKMNVFHWHLTDDQGWRIEIKKYPKLTEIGAWRNGSMIGHYNEQKFDTIRYGGYYTQEEIKEVVEYAKQNHITIVPEIEMPGHSLAALSAYPQYSCTGGPFEVGKAWGVYDDVFCAGNDSTFIFLQNILDEVMDLFPGEYIHIGGDECPKTRWEKCEKCQRRIRNLPVAAGENPEHQLQSYFIQRIEKYVNTKGKKIIGWDEILEGGLAPNAAVMSWRGTEGGIAAAKEKHFVVMTPGSHCYFDHYQGNPRFEPLAIGGNTTLEKVYSYEPIPEGLTEDEAKYILGAQGNVWTEYMYDEKQVEYMVLPRMLALSEVLWSEKEQCNMIDFKKRLLNQIEFLSKNKFKYSDPFCKLDLTTSTLNEGISLKFSYDPNFTKINYDGWYPKDSMIYAYEYIYQEKIKINRDTIFRIGIENTNKKYSPEYFYEIKLNISKSTSKKITFSTPPSKYYNTDADFKLVDGIKGFYPKINSEWLAWQGEDVEIIIDLGEKTSVKRIELGSLYEKNSWIYPPSEVKIELSNNKIKYKLLKTIKSEPGESEIMPSFGTSFKSLPARYVKVTLKNPGLIPEGNPGAGNPSWMFFDEILID